MKYSIVETRTYRKSVKRYTRSGKFSRKKLEGIIDLLASDKKIPKKYKDHELSGNMKGFRECHIEPDLLLVYIKKNDVMVLVLVALGSHSKLFE